MQTRLGTPKSLAAMVHRRRLEALAESSSGGGLGRLRQMAVDCRVDVLCRRKAHGVRPLRLEVARPASDDGLDRGVALEREQLRVAARAPQRRHLVGAS